MGDDTAVRYTNTVLYDDDFNKIVGDVLLHNDGSWSKSNGDEDVVEEIDGSQRVLTPFVAELAHPPRYAIECSRFQRWLPIASMVERSHLSN